MTSFDASLIITAVGLVGSWGGAAFIAGYRWGSVKTRLDIMESAMKETASKDQLAGVKEDVAEIKGMFRMTLRDGSG
jgi:hypothetical protein